MPMRAEGVTAEAEGYNIMGFNLYVGQHGGGGGGGWAENAVRV